MLDIIKSITSSLLQIGLLLPLILLIRHNYTKKEKLLLVLAALILISEGIITTGFNFTLSQSQLWNWTGKSASLTAAILFVCFNPILRKNDIGFINHFKPLTSFSILFVSVTFLFLRLIPKVVAGNFHPFHLETFAFQSTLPGFSEEIIYRGILLGLLNKVYLPAITIFKAKVGWGILIVSMVFGLVHGITLDKHWQIVFSSQRFCMTLGFGFILAWLKERSGSLLPSVIFHNLWNLIVVS